MVSWFATGYGRAFHATPSISDLSVIIAPVAEQDPAAASPPRRDQIHHYDGPVDPVRCGCLAWLARLDGASSVIKGSAHGRLLQGTGTIKTMQSAPWCRSSVSSTAITIGQPVGRQGTSNSSRICAPGSGSDDPSRSGQPRHPQGAVTVRGPSASKVPSNRVLT